MGFALQGSVTIDHTKCGSSDSTNFPVYISLSDNSLKTVANGGSMQNANAFDLLWFNDFGMGTALNFEIDSYDGSAGTYKVYVQVPTLSHTTNTTIYFGYGDPSITGSQENIASTWSNGFVTVLHFRNGTTLDLTDSTGNLTALTAQGTTSAVAGLVGLGAASVGSGFSSGFKDTSHVGLTACPVTLECVAKPTAFGNGNTMVQLNPASGAAVDLEFRSTGAVRMNSGAVAATTTATVATGATHHFCGSSSSQDQRQVYIDGGSKIANSTAHVTANGTFTQTWVGIGINSANAVIDEVRVSNVQRSDDWVLATANNLLSPSTFTPTITYASNIVSGNSGNQAATSSISSTAYWYGSNRMLSIDITLNSNTRTVSSLTYGGANCTFIGAENNGAQRVEAWRIHASDPGAPVAGNNTLAATLSGSCECAALWVNRTKVNATTPIESFASASGTNSGSATDASIGVTTLTDKSIVHGAIVTTDTSITPNQTSRNNVPGTSGSGSDEDPGSATSPAGSVTLSWTGLGTTAAWAALAYAVRPDSVAGLFKARANYDNSSALF